MPMHPCQSRVTSTLSCYEAKTKVSYLRIQHENPGIGREVSLADTLGKHDMQEQRFSCLGIRLYQQRADSHITQYSL